MALREEGDTGRERAPFALVGAEMPIGAGTVGSPYDAGTKITRVSASAAGRAAEGAGAAVRGS